MSDRQPDNAYGILGVPKGADGPTLRRVFRSLALKHHPDAVPADEKEQAALRFARINQAYELVRDPETRRRYDDLLDRGITPDLSQEVGVGAGLPSLAQILGEIQTLDMDEQSGVKRARAMPDGLVSLLEHSLIDGENLRESVFDCVRFGRIIEARGFAMRNIRFDGGWLVVTELRVIILAMFTRFNNKATTHYYRIRAFPYASLKDLEVTEVGRAFPSYRVRLVDDDGKVFELGKCDPRFTRLFLVANAYRLPLRVTRTGTQGREYGRATLLSLGALLVALLFGTALARISAPQTSPPRPPDPTVRGHAEGTVAVCLPMLLFAWLALRVHRAWGIGRAEEVVGPLPDLADGAADQAPARPPPEIAESPSPQRDLEIPETPPAGAEALPVEIPEAVRAVLGLGTAGDVREGVPRPAEPSPAEPPPAEPSPAEPPPAEPPPAEPPPAG
jgi:hypothetical protein